MPRFLADGSKLLLGYGVLATTKVLSELCNVFADDRLPLAFAWPFSLH
jgi:hypothetical protein